MKIRTILTRLLGDLTKRTPKTAETKPTGTAYERQNKREIKKAVDAQKAKNARVESVIGIQTPKTPYERFRFRLRQILRGRRANLIQIGDTQSYDDDTCGEWYK